METIRLCKPQTNIISIRVTALQGYPEKNSTKVYFLSNDIVLLESKKESGHYSGTTFSNGLYLKNGELYYPVKNQEGELQGFMLMCEYLNCFDEKEQEILSLCSASDKHDLLETLIDLRNIITDVELKTIISKVYIMPEHQVWSLIHNIKYIYSQSESVST